VQGAAAAAKGSEAARPLLDSRQGPCPEAVCDICELPRLEDFDPRDLAKSKTADLLDAMSDPVNVEANGRAPRRVELQALRRRRLRGAAARQEATDDQGNRG
jgi:hypothetical protein